MQIVQHFDTYLVVCLCCYTGPEWSLFVTKKASFTMTPACVTENGCRKAIMIQAVLMLVRISFSFMGHRPSEYTKIECKKCHVGHPFTLAAISLITQLMQAFFLSQWHFKCVHYNEPGYDCTISCSNQLMSH
uniref:Uncharacterized protein n=1 Tax=Rhipicephalus microplus TaxID=6941 RepID=A0A6G5AG59_RHIMP